jgi:hypothetical protein
MPEKDKDDLADALERLAAGEVPSAPDGVPSEQVPLAPDKPQRPATPGGVPARPAAPMKKPSSPRAVTPPAGPTSHQLPKKIAPQRPAAPKPNRPAEPSLSQAPAPPRASSPPSAPATPSAAPNTPADIGTSLANVIDDGDAVIVPAPDPGALAHRPPRKRAKSQPLYARLSFRRTLIPILLTMGVALPGCAIWWCFLDADSPLKSISISFPITLAAVGLVLLGLGVMNMLFVKHQLEQQTPR